MPLSEVDKKFLEVAISEAKEGFDEGGIPIGACLVSKDGKVIAKGRNQRMQKHIDCLNYANSSEDRRHCMVKPVAWKMQVGSLPKCTRSRQW